MRLVFFGTPDFSVPTLERLLRSRHSVAGVVSQPDRRRGRGRKTTPSPVSAVALREGLPLYRAEKIGDAEATSWLRELSPDLGVVVAFGQFIPKRIREASSLGYLINGHASILPSYRGAAPIARAVLEGETRTGISVMRVEREMDAGPVALVRETGIGPDETAGELTERLAQLCAEAVLEVVDRIAGNGTVWSEQEHARATLAPKIERADSELDWSQSANALVRRVRAMAPTPGAHSTLDATVISILSARAEAGVASSPPGTVQCGSDRVLRVATGDGWLVPLRVKRPGGKELAIDAYMRGRPIPDGARFDPPATLDD